MSVRGWRLWGRSTGIWMSVGRCCLRDTPTVSFRISEAGTCLAPGIRKHDDPCVQKMCLIMGVHLERTHGLKART